MDILKKIEKSFNFYDFVFYVNKNNKKQNISIVLYRAENEKKTIKIFEVFYKNAMRNGLAKAYHYEKEDEERCFYYFKNNRRFGEFISLDHIVFNNDRDSITLGFYEMLELGSDISFIL